MSSSSHPPPRTPRQAATARSTAGQERPVGPGGLPLSPGVEAVLGDGIALVRAAQAAAAIEAFPGFAWRRKATEWKALVAPPGGLQDPPVLPGTRALLQDGVDLVRTARTAAEVQAIPGPGWHVRAQEWVDLATSLLPGVGSPPQVPPALPLRPLVARFAMAMEARLAAHDRDKVPYSLLRDPTVLVDALRQHVRALRRHIAQGSLGETTLRDAVNLANYAAMIADVATRLSLSQGTDP